jgi:hypothetical protein
VAQRERQRQLVERLADDIGASGFQQGQPAGRIARPDDRDHRRCRSGLQQRRSELAGADHRVTRRAAIEVTARFRKLADRGDAGAGAIEQQMERAARVVIGPHEQDVLQHSPAG